MKYISLFEYIFVFFYISFLMILATFIKPTFITNTILFIYCIITTFNILILCNFSNNNKNKKYIITFLISFIYSLFCVYCYIFFHKTIKKNIIPKQFFIIIPILYLINLKIYENLFQCRNYHGIYWFFENIQSILNKYIIS